MRVLVLYAHPVAESYHGALHGCVVEKLLAAGHEVDDCDLYGEEFDACLSADERRQYHDVSSDRGTVAGHIERLRAAEALVLVFPVWNFGFPAILKGYFDRVFLPGVSFVLDAGRVRTKLHNIGQLVAVTGYGGPRLAAFLTADPPRRIVKRILRRTIRPGARVRYLAHYDMNRSTAASRERFLARVGRTMAGL